MAWSTFPSQNVQNTPFSDHFWTVVARSTFPSQNVQNTPCSDHLSKKCTPLWREAHFQDVVLPGSCEGFTWQSEQNVGVCSISKNDGKPGTFAADLQRCISRGRRSTRDMFIKDVRRSGRWFPERGCIRKTHWHEAVSSALNYPFLKDVPQNCSVFAVVSFEYWVWKNCFVFDVATFKTWGSLVELLCFWRCHVQTLRKPRRIPAFWTTTPPRYTTLQLQLHYTTPHPAVVVRWPLQPLQPLRKNNSNHLSVHQWDSLCHPWFTLHYTTTTTALHHTTSSSCGEVTAATTATTPKK